MSAKKKEKKNKKRNEDGQRKINFLNEVSSRVIKRDVDRDNPTRINYIREGFFSLEEE